MARDRAFRSNSFGISTTIAFAFVNSRYLQLQNRLLKISLPTVFIRKFQAIYADTGNSNPLPSSYFCDQKPGPIAKIFHRFSFVVPSQNLRVVSCFDTQSSCFVGMKILHLTHVFQVQKEKERHFVFVSYRRDIDKVFILSQKTALEKAR